MSRISENLEHQEENYIFPFFWQNGAAEGVLTTELQRIYDSNVRAFCVEARPHPDYGGAGWWHDMDIIMEFARSHQMKVWLLDDDRFPSGHANKIFSAGEHPLAVRFLTVHNTDVSGPIDGGHMLVKSLLTDDDELIGVVACQRCGGENDDLRLETAVDITNQVENGWLNCDIPAGLWRIMVFYTTRHGNGKLDYFNILDTASVKLLLDQVYEPHYEHYRADFGKTFQGFFSDEPEFSNLPGYRFQARLGEDMPFIPWSGELKERLLQRWREKFLLRLPALWYQAGRQTPHIRYEYMDETTRQLAVSFAAQISDWCQAHGVSHIGHIVEDDNVHGRLGCSTGHYFRSLSGMRMAGIDVVTQQIMPEMDQKYHQWVASDQDGEFFHYGLGKLGSSLAHIDPGKQGDALCEIFGAFGWQEGIGLMKWLTDHMFSRGINHFVPHAFSMKQFPDPDCPPHFYAHGNHPQYAHFGLLMQYMNRLSHLFSGGVYPANIAVLYHAEAEWAGEAMLFQRPVRVMLEHQLDCDIIPADLLKEDNSYGAVFTQGIRLKNQVYQVLLIPGCEYLPESTAEFIIQHQNSIKIMFVEHRPIGICEETAAEAELILQLNQIECISLAQLGERVRREAVPFIVTDGCQSRLRTYPYLSSDGNCYVFCFHEDSRRTLKTELRIRAGSGEMVYAYDAVRNEYQQVLSRFEEGMRVVELTLKPNEARVLVLPLAEAMPAVQSERQDTSEAETLDGTFVISCRWVKETEWHRLGGSTGTEDFPDFTVWAQQKEFCGVLKYTAELTQPEKTRAELELFGGIDCADIFVNGVCADRLLGMPMNGRLELQQGKNRIEIEVPVTPVWSVGDAWSALTVLPGIGLKEKPRLKILRF